MAHARPRPGASPRAGAGGAGREISRRNWRTRFPDLVSVPFQFNWEQNVGPSEATRFILNVQPVMPFALNKDWNLIAR